MRYKNIINKIISISLIVIMFGHLTFLHHDLQNYVLCIGIDGHATVENPDECTECLHLSLFESLVIPGQSIVDINNCEDTPLNENCIDANKFILKNKIILAADLSASQKIIEPLKNEVKTNCFIKKKYFKENYILQNYTTVSLLI